MKRLNGIDARNLGMRVRQRWAMVLALGLIASTVQATTTITYTYDASDHVTSVTDTRGLVTSYVYDGLGHLWQQSSPDTGTTSYSYDGIGRRASMTRANGVQTTYTYDAIGRVTVLSAGGQSQRFTYDSCANGLGRMCTAADANGSVGYSYTPEGWISGRAFTVGSTSYTVGYAYNAMGQVVTVVYPDGNQALYNYTNGVVSSVSLNIGGAGRAAASQITYQPQDKAMANWVGSNGLTTTLYYDTDGRFTGANVPGVLTYGVYYDNASRIIRKQDFISPILTESFGYDDQSRLVSVQGGAENEAYQYDANGNRIAQTVNGTSMNIVYDSGSNRMINAGGVTFAYDAMGNSTVANGISRWQFDPFNRMTTAFGNTYYIDPLGQRLMKSVSGRITYFAPDESNRLIAENDSGLWVDYLWLNGRLIARTHGGQMEDIHLDQVGRPEAMTNADQTLAWRAGNTPFSRWIGTDNAVPLNIGFPGQYYDAELSLWNNGYRDYFPWVGRYLESDPIGLEGGANTYAYAHSDPVRRGDPLGLDDTVCMYNTGMCGMQNNAAAHTDVFAFASMETKEVGTGMFHGVGEGVLLVGYNPYDGFYNGSIEAVGGHIGDETRNLGGFVGKEFTSYGTPKTIYLGEFNVGQGFRGLGGIGRGAGVFYTCDEAGFYVHGTFSIFGHEAAVGIGFGTNH